MLFIDRRVNLYDLVTSCEHFRTHVGGSSENSTLAPTHRFLLEITSDINDVIFFVLLNLYSAALNSSYFNCSF